MGEERKKAAVVNTNVNILLIGIFADDYLTDIAAKRIKDAGYGNIAVLKKDNLAKALADKNISDLIEGWEKKPKNACVLPLFVRDELGDGKDCGLKCPYEFVIERRDLLDSGKYNAVKALGERIGIILKLLNRESPGGEDVGVKFDDFKDWMSGVMRKYLFLDDTAHGTSGYIDPKDQNWDWSEWFKKEDFGKWKKRFSSGPADDNDPLKTLKPLMKELWRQYFNDGRSSLASLPEKWNEDLKEKLDKIYNIVELTETDKINGFVSLPLSQGDRARFVTPTGKINVLLIDDDPEKSLLCIDEKIKETFSVQQFKLTPNDFPKLEGLLQEILRSHLSYNFALVDLCFGEDPGNDPLGYHVIKKLSKLFPHMPIVVYSRYKDMGHITRAFQCGAMWFLEKGEEQKLARHLMDVVKKGSWKREWRAMQGCNPVVFIYSGKDQAFDDKFRSMESWQYLTAKCLEYFPGKFIEVKKMGGGISTASTFCVQKGLKLDGRPLQSPMIIKIDTAPNTRMEFERYFRYIRPYMANEAGRIENPCIIIERNCSAIVYTFAGRQDEAHALDSMKSMLKEDIVFKASCDYEKYRKAFDMIFDEILPKVHRVTPNREFGDGEENRHRDVFSKPSALDAKDAPGASFPNLQFGEVEERNFYQSYLIRFPHFGKRRLGCDAFDEQPTFTITEDEDKKGRKIQVGKSGAHPYEFHDICENEDGSIDLEVYDYKDDRRPCLLTGSLATHVAKFRQQLYPGMTLWVQGVEEDGQQTKVLLFETRIGSANHNFYWKDYVGRYRQVDALIGSCGQMYFTLVDDVISFCRALYGVDNVNYEKYLAPSHDSSFGELEVKKFFEHIRGRFKCPIAICHGDLNYGNIMLESRKHPPKDETPDVSQTITDAWLIDFAKTRRDMIAHDFNVMFTDTFGLLFDTRLFDADKNVNKAEEKYETRLNDILPRFIRDVMFAENSNPPDYLKNDARFVFVYKILRRIRKAALGAGISKDMYTLTTVLECLLTLKLHLNKNMKNIRASAALFAVAKICFDQLCDDVELDLLTMDKDGKTNKQRQTPQTAANPI